MIPLFIGLTLVNLLGLGATVALGYFRGTDPTAAASRHMLAGALAAITCCAVHSVVFTYFIATAKWLQHAIAVKQLDPALVGPTRSFKAQAFPAALLAMVTTFAATVLGAAADNYDGPWPARHHVVAWVAVGVNVAVAAVEFRAIRRNGLLIDQVLTAVGAFEPAER